LLPSVIGSEAFGCDSVILIVSSSTASIAVTSDRSAAPGEPFLLSRR
jgi:hypothetical protein